MTLLPLLIQLLLNTLFRLATYEAEFRLKRLRRWAVSDRQLETRIVFLEDLVRKLQGENEALRELLLHEHKCHYSIRQRLLVLRFMEIYRIPRSKITEQFGIARSTLYRWLHRLEDDPKDVPQPANKTPMELVRLIWKIIQSNPTWGRHRVAMQAWLLKVFVSPSTVRNILSRPRPTEPKPPVLVPAFASVAPWFIRASRPNHVWSIDMTVVRRWGLWPTHVLAVIDHFSRKALAVRALEGPTAGWVVEALKGIIEQFGPPIHLISDQDSIFKSKAFAELLDIWKVKHRFGAVGKHGSIAVTERLIRTLKYEWLKRVPILRGIDHLQEVCDGFVEWYNQWRPHTHSTGATPETIYTGREWKKPDHNAKTVPRNVQPKLFHETGVVGFKIAA
jgi:transposase InsO family protein